MYEKYKKHILPEDEAEWYGLSLKEAIEKMKDMQTSSSVQTEKPIRPLKEKYREEFIEILKAQQLEQVTAPKQESSWMSRFKSD